MHTVRSAQIPFSQQNGQSIPEPIRVGRKFPAMVGGIYSQRETAVLDAMLVRAERIEKRDAKKDSNTNNRNRQSYPKQFPAALRHKV
jgi:hypothetical protein